MQQIFQLANFSFIATIMIFDRFPKLGWAKRDAWRGFTGNGKKSLSLARLVKSKSSIATSSGSEVRDVKTSLVIGGFSEETLKAIYVVAKANYWHAAKSTGSLLYTHPNQLLQKPARDLFETMSQKDPHMHVV